MASLFKDFEYRHGPTGEMRKKVKKFKLGLINLMYYITTNGKSNY